MYLQLKSVTFRSVPYFLIKKQNRSLSDEILLGGLLQILTETEPEKLERWERFGAALLKRQRHEIKESASAQEFTQSEVRSQTQSPHPPPRLGIFLSYDYLTFLC